jgi:ferrochelatase
MSRRVQELLQRRIDLPVELAMRYGEPSIPEVVQTLASRNVEEILLLPLYPHYAMSSYETVVERVRDIVRKKAPRINLKILPPFYQDPDYLSALVASAQPFLEMDYDHILFTFHGLPERHLKLSDRSKTHCLSSHHCCVSPHEAHKTCYRAQVLSTVYQFVQRTGIPEEKYSVSFQSRLGRDPWLKPYTDHELALLPSRGVRKLLVISPAFVSDCLETLEELGIRGKETFLQAGGKEYGLIPCMNDHPHWIEALSNFVDRLRYGTFVEKVEQN